MNRNFKLTTLIIGAMFLINMNVALAEVNLGSDMESTDMIENRLTTIDTAYTEAKSIPSVPSDTKKAAVEETVPASLTSDQVLDLLIKTDKEEKSMDFDFDETELESILRTIGSLAEINIALDPTLKATKLDLHLKNVKIREALNIMADSYGLAFKKIGDSLYVTTKDKLRNDNLTSRLIKLRNVKAAEIKSMTGSLVEKINISEDTNSMIVVGTLEEIKKIEELVKKIDVSQPQVVLEAKIIEINKDALKDLGVDWSDTVGTSMQETGRTTDLGKTAVSDGASLAKVAAFSRTPIQVNALIHMLENQNKAKVLSNPRIITLNNQQSEIFVGDRIPYTINSVTGGTASTEVRFVEPGIRLRITPSIIDNDFVVIKIEPEVSYVYDFRGGENNNQYPWVKTRNATAFVRIKNNQPFVLGGLLNQEDKKALYQVPLLGKVPLLGNLFSYERHTVTDSELIITVTPTVVTQN